MIVILWFVGRWADIRDNSCRLNPKLEVNSLPQV